MDLKVSESCAQDLIFKIIVVIDLVYLQLVLSNF